MPEGPEIRLAADGLNLVLSGQKVDEVEMGLPHLQCWRSVLAGQRVSRVYNRGKAMLTQFEHGVTIYSHNQLYGLWQIFPRHKVPDSGRQLRLALHTKLHSTVLYSASDISVWPTETVHEHPFLSRLGPDVLSDNLDWQTLKARFLKPEFRNRRFAQLLLDQHFLAGIGNYLRSEILFDAGFYPWHRPDDLSEVMLGKLARSALKISWRSYQAAGVTNTARWARRGRNKGLTFEEYRFLVFNREGQACYRCDQEIVNTAAASRRLYWCPVCQSGEIMG